MKKFIDKVSGLFKAIKKTTEDIKKQKINEIKEVEEFDRKIKSLKVKDLESSDILGNGALKFWLIGAFVVYVSYLVFQSLDIIYLFFAAYILSVAMESLIEIFERRKMKRVFAIALSYIIVLIFLLSGFVIVIPFMLDQTADIIKVIINQVNAFQDILQKQGLESLIAHTSWTPVYIKNYLIQTLHDKNLLLGIQNSLQQNISTIISQGTSTAKNIGSLAVTLLGGVFSVLFQVALVFTGAILLSIEKDGVIKFLSRVAGNRSEYIQLKIEKMYKKLGIWLRSQLFLCLFIFVCVYTALLLMQLFGLDLTNKLSLALISGFTEFIPYLGPILGSIPALIVAGLSHGLTGMIIVGLVYYLIQWLENNVFIPVLMNRMLGISPTVIFMCVIIGGLILGFIGVLLAVPIAVIVTLLFDD